MDNCCNTPQPQKLTTDTCSAVGPVFLAYEAQLKGFVQKRILDKDETNDILQQLYLKIYSNCEQLPEVKNMKAWLYQITRNAVYDFFRESSRYQTITEFELEELPDQTRHDVEALVEPLIGLLPQEYAEALRLSELEGISQKQIAEQLGISYSGAKSRVQRGREKLKALFIECCHLEFSHDGSIMSATIKDSCKPLQKHKKPINIFCDVSRCK